VCLNNDRELQGVLKDVKEKAPQFGIPFLHSYQALYRLASVPNKQFETIRIESLGGLVGYQPAFSPSSLGLTPVWRNLPKKRNYLVCLT